MEPADREALPDQAERRGYNAPARVTMVDQDAYLLFSLHETAMAELRAERDANAAECRRLVVEYAGRVPARCQHCPTPTPADERSFMCSDCASEADLEVITLREENERLREALARIERLKARWDAPLTHPVGDMSDPAYAGAAAWAAVGSEAHKIAQMALQTDEEGSSHA